MVLTALARGIKKAEDFFTSGAKPIGSGWTEPAYAPKGTRVRDVISGQKSADELRYGEKPSGYERIPIRRTDDYYLGKTKITRREAVPFSNREVVIAEDGPIFTGRERMAYTSAAGGAAFGASETGRDTVEKTLKNASLAYIGDPDE